MSGVPPELRDYVEPLVRVGYVTQSVYERCVEEAVRLGLSRAAGDALVRALAEEHGALLEAPSRASVTERQASGADDSPLAVTTAWAPPASSESNPEVSTRPDALQDVPDDSEERGALAAAAAETLADAAPDEDEPAGILSESSSDDDMPSLAETSASPAGVPSAGREPSGAALAEPADWAEVSSLEGDEPREAAGGTGSEGGELGEASEQGEASELSEAGEPSEAGELSEASEPSEARPALVAVGGGPGGLPWLHLAPAAIAPLLALLFVLGGGLERVRASWFGGGDPFEPNNSFATAQPLPPGKHTGLTLLRDDVDWFRITVPAGQGLRIRFEQVVHNATISLHDAQGVRLERVGMSAGELVYVPLLEEGAEEVFLVMSGSSPDVITLEVALIDPRLRFEENDTPETAAEVTGGRVATLTCDGQDWFKVTVPAYRVLWAEFVAAAPGLGLRVLDATQALPAAGSVAALSSRASLPAIELPRQALIQVQGQGNYGLQLDLGEVDGRLARARGEALEVYSGTLEPNNSKASAVPLPPGSYPNLRCDGNDYYWVTLPARHTLTLEWEASNVSLSFPGLRSRVYGDDLDSTQEGLLRRVVYAERDLRVLVRAQGLGAYPLTCKVTEGRPGRELKPGVYPQIPTRGDDLFWFEVDAGQKLDLTFQLGDSEYYGYGTHCVLFSVPLESEAGRRPAARRTETEYLSGYARVSRRYYARELVFLSVRQARRPYDLTLALGGEATPTEEGGYRPPNFEQVGPGSYPDRGLVGGEGVFGITVGEDQTVRAKIAFSAQAGDLDIELFDSHGTQVESSTGSGNDETVVYRSPVTQRMYLFVRDLSGDGTRFDLEVSLDDVAQPGDKTLQLAPGLHSGLVCAGEVLYALQVEPGQVVRAEVKSLDESGELDLGLLDQAGKEVFRSTELGAEERIEYMVDYEGVMYLRVVGSARRFDLKLAIGDQ